VKKTLELPEVKKRIEDTGAIIVANTPAEFTTQIKAELAVYKDVVQKQKLKLD
jgi:tripartite-type tricarboxylate transporter receptor subunit TctC